MMDAVIENINRNTKYKIHPEEWIDLYSDEFYSTSYKLTNDEKLSSTIVEKTFLNALSGIENYVGDIDEKVWLLNILNKQIDEQLKKASLSESLASNLKKYLKEIPKIQIEAFIRKTFYKENNNIICDKLKITEELLWKYIHNVRKELISSHL